MHAAGTDEAGRPFCSRYIRHVSFLPLASVTRISNARMRIRNETAATMLECATAKDGLLFTVRYLLIHYPRQCQLSPEGVCTRLRKGLHLK